MRVICADNVYVWEGRSIIAVITQLGVLPTCCCSCLLPFTAMVLIVVHDCEHGSGLHCRILEVESLWAVFQECVMENLKLS